MQHKLKPSRPIRIDRDPPIQHLEDDTGHLWAVSYADFLMVLLSFFILFFSVTDKDKDAIDNIVASLKISKNSNTEKTSSVTSISQTTSAALAASVSPSEIATLIKNNLKNIKFEVGEKTKSVTFILEDNIFREGRTTPSVLGKKSLIELLNLLQPYKEEIDMVFVGHTDSVPVSKSKTPNIENNFDLSALRASVAVKIAMKFGLPKERLFIYGAADNDRKSKTISLIIRPKGMGRL